MPPERQRISCEQGKENGLISRSCFEESVYSYSMGDAFTFAGWVLAVGAFISSAILDASVGSLQYTTP